jgi:hypothetical protein
LATKFTYKKRSGEKWDVGRGNPQKRKKIWGKMYSGGAVRYRDRECLYPNPYRTAKTLLLGRVSQVEKKPGPRYASKIKNISQINIKIQDKLVPTKLAV